MWNPGESVTLRGIYQHQIWIVQSGIVVKDEPEEVALAILPGAQCSLPEGYIKGKHGPAGRWSRWEDYQTGRPNLQQSSWHTNRMLVLMQPETYYASIYFWRHETNEFLCYYVNFQLPFTRSPHGFDTLDLELDIVIEPSYEWHWKDAEEYKDGIAQGVLLPEWTGQIDRSKEEVFQKIEGRQYPFDGSWLGWKPDPDWAPSKLPPGWDQL